MSAGAREDGQVHNGTTTRTAVSLTAIAVILATWNPAVAGLIWFDETGGGNGYATFGELVNSYRSFMGTPSCVIDFNDLPEWTSVSNQYSSTDGVTFRNTANGQYASFSGTHAAGGGIAQNVTGYDGSYMPSGDMLYVKFDNNLRDTPFTLDFASPVSRVGAFVGMGVEGDIHTLTIKAYDAGDQLLSTHTVVSWLWESDPYWQNYESFFGVRVNGARISHLEIMNNATTDFANALILDNLGFDPGVRSNVPEPATLAFVAAGAFIVLRRRRESCD